MQIRRAGVTALDGQGRPGTMRRGIAELATYLFSNLDFPAGVLLMTGTSVVPDLDAQRGRCEHRDPRLWAHW